MSENILKIKSLNKHFANFELKDVSFELRKGEIVGFIGRNGAGKSTTLNTLLSYVHPDSGRITFWGMNPQKQSKEIKEKIGFVSAGMTYYMKKNIKKITHSEGVAWFRS